MSEDNYTDKVWISDPETVWRSAEVIGYDEETRELEVVAEVFARSETKTVPLDKTLSYDKDHEADFSNAFMMSDLNEAALLNLLLQRSLEDRIYTFTGDILLSVNPYKTIPKLYEPMPKREDLNIDDSDADPHLYVLAARAYRDLFSKGIRGKSQAVLINGESGAGKTEAAKRIMAFLMNLSQQKRKENEKKKGKSKNKNPYNPYNRRRNRNKKKKGKKGKNGEDREQSPIELIILKTNPLMEAFGNARTIRNDNSSRFGKFVQLEYSQEELIKGAKTRHFLLEKSRVTAHGRGERNYHIFYQMCAAFESNREDPVFNDLQMLKSFEHYKYLTATEDNFVRKKKPEKRAKGGDVKRDGAARMAERAVAYMSNHREEIFQMDIDIYTDETKNAMNEINIEEEHQTNIWKVLAAILHLGNLEFETVKKPDKWGKMVDMTDVTIDTVDINGVQRSTIDLCAELLGVKVDLLIGALTRKTFSAGARLSVTEVPLSLAEASKSRDGLAKAMYEALFEWILQKINEATGSAVQSLVAAQSGMPFNMSRKTKAPPERNQDVFIGILDIFGFEMLEENSFEQLCINYANEALQGMFDNHLIELEKKGYADENIDFESLNLKFRENQSLLDMLNKRGTGIFQLMDEQGALGARGGDDKLFRSIAGVHGRQRRGPRRKKKKDDNSSNVIGESRFAGAEEDDDGRFYFRINHFAGIVTYSLAGMVEKNADHLQADLADLIAIGGMPKKDPSLTKEEIERLELEERMGAKKEKKSIKIEIDPNQTDSFAFLRQILRMRQKNSKGTDEEEPVEEDNPASRRRGRGRGRKGKKMAKLQSVSSRFRKQMTDLQELLKQTQQHFVRCIKPNDYKLPPSEKWDYHMVNQQLRMLGALEMVRVRREGFPIRTIYEDFLLKYPELVAKHEIDWSKGVNDRQACVAFMSIFDKEGKNRRWYLGETKILLQEASFKGVNEEERKIRELKQEREEKLRRLRERKEREAKMVTASLLLQTLWRGYTERSKYNKYKNAIIVLQAAVRRKIYSKPLSYYVKKVILIQKCVRGLLARQRYRKLGNLAAMLTPIAQGYITRTKTDDIFKKRHEYEIALESGECILLESHCVTDKLKTNDRMTSKPCVLLLTTGPSPRILLVNKLSGAIALDLNWDERVLCGLMANESKLVIYTKPSEFEDIKQARRRQNAQNIYRFTFEKSVAALWLLALKGVHTIHDILSLRVPDYDKVIAENPGLSIEEIQDHGNMLPLHPRLYKKFLFGGEGVVGGNSRVGKQQIARLNQKNHWRSRYFVLKNSTLFWFQTQQNVGQAIVKTGVYPVGGINLSTETTINMANTNPQFFNKQVKQKLSLEIESRVLRASLKINFPTQKYRQTWVTKMKIAVKNQVSDSQELRLSLSAGVLDKKAYMNVSPDEVTPAPSVHTAESEAIHLVEEEDHAEDIEQGLIEEIF